LRFSRRRAQENARCARWNARGLVLRTRAATANTALTGKSHLSSAAIMKTGRYHLAPFTKIAECASTSPAAWDSRAEAILKTNAAASEARSYRLAESAVLALCAPNLRATSIPFVSVSPSTDVALIEGAECGPGGSRTARGPPSVAQQRTKSRGLGNK